MSGIILEGKHLTREFSAGRGRKLHAVSDVSLELREGETLGLVGESGCGKSTLGRMLIRLLAPTSGEVFMHGRSLTAMSGREFSKYRREFQLIFQDPYASLDPRMTVRDIIAEPLVTYRICPTKEETTRRVLELMHINREEHAVSRLCQELGYESAQIYRVKDRALLHLAQLRYGAGYQP